MLFMSVLSIVSSEVTSLLMFRVMYVVVSLVAVVNYWCGLGILEDICCCVEGLCVEVMVLLLIVLGGWVSVRCFW